MSTRHFSILFLAAIFSVSLSHARDYKDFKNILFDVRGSRGGNGDVSAGYLFARELIYTQGVKSPITLLVNEDAERILSTLTGKSVKHGDTIEHGLIKIQNYDLLTGPPAPFDLVFHLARPSGLNYLSEHYRSGEKTEDSRPFREALPANHDNALIDLTPDAHMVVQTVLGNTENVDAKQPFGMLTHRNRLYFTQPAGIAAGESGIYLDTSALSLRDKTREQLKKATLDLLPQYYSAVFGPEKAESGKRSELFNRLFRLSDISAIRDLLWENRYTWDIDRQSARLLESVLQRNMPIPERENLFADWGIPKDIAPYRSGYFRFPLTTAEKNDESLSSKERFGKNLSDFLNGKMLAGAKSGFAY